MKKVLLIGLLAVAGVSVSAQNLIKNEKFATEVTNKVTNPNKATAGEWFIMNIYVLTFYAKVKEAGTPVSVYIKQTNEEKNDNGKLNTTFFMRRDYDADAQPNASGAQYNFKIKDAGKWTKVVVYYDMGQVVNTISSKKSNPDMEVSDTDDDAAILKDCYVAILGQNKGGVVEISDVTLKKK